MLLVEALGVREGEVITFVGGGGKTTAMFRLAKELCYGGKEVVVTTTTKIFPPTPDQARCTLLNQDWEELGKEAKEALERYNVVVIALGLGPEGKLVGIPSVWVARLRALAGVNSVLVEGDGSARKPFKAPLSHEPLIPDCSDLVIPMVGVEVVGKPLTEENVQRARRVAELTGLSWGEAVTAQAVAQVMLHPEGNTRGAPSGARIVPMINKVDDASRLNTAREIAEHLLALGARRVVIARSASETPVVEVVCP